jgi:hypothetical protein
MQQVLNNGFAAFFEFEISFVEKHQESRRKPTATVRKHPTSFVTQRFQGIDSGRTANRHPTGQQRNTDEQQANSYQSGWVARFHFKEKRFQNA